MNLSSAPKNAAPLPTNAAGFSSAEQQLFQLPAVEANHYFAIDQRHRRGHVAELFEFRQGRRVLGDVALRMSDAVL